jgi:hypothetical protein
MAIRDTMAKNAEPFLQPGEQIQAVFPAQTTSAYMALISIWIILLKNAYRVVVVTDRRIIVAKSGRFRMTPVKSIDRELPRSTIIGPTSGLWYRCENLGSKLYINKRFHKDVDVADSLRVLPPPMG